MKGKLMTRKQLEEFKYNAPDYINDLGVTYPDKAPKDESVDDEEFQTCVKWLESKEESIDINKATRHLHNSYKLKHVVEKETGKYISNGAFIAAALICDVKHKIPRLSDVNMDFYFKL